MKKLIIIFYCSFIIVVACSNHISEIERFEQVYTEFNELKDLIISDSDIVGMNYWSDHEEKIYYKNNKASSSSYSLYKKFFERNKFVGGIFCGEEHFPYEIAKRYDMNKPILSVFFTYKYKTLWGINLSYAGILYCPAFDLSRLSSSEIRAVGYHYARRTKHIGWYEVSYE